MFFQLFFIAILPLMVWIFFARKMRKACKSIKYECNFDYEEKFFMPVTFLGAGLITTPIIASLTTIMIGPVLVFHATRFVYMFMMRFLCCCVC
jgi:hypothetical protein